MLTMIDRFHPAWARGIEDRIWGGGREKKGGKRMVVGWVWGEFPCLGNR